MVSKPFKHWILKRWAVLEMGCHVMSAVYYFVSVNIIYPKHTNVIKFRLVLILISYRILCNELNSFQFSVHTLQDTVEGLQQLYILCECIITQTLWVNKIYSSCSKSCQKWHLKVVFSLCCQSNEVLLWCPRTICTFRDSYSFAHLN